MANTNREDAFQSLQKAIVEFGLRQDKSFWGTRIQEELAKLHHDRRIPSDVLYCITRLITATVCDVLNLDANLPHFRLVEEVQKYVQQNRQKPLDN